MSTGLIGGLIGLVIGLAYYFVFGSLIRKLETKRAAAAANALNIARTAQLVAFPVAGYLIGSMLF